MTERARFLAVLDGKKPDKPPWYADLSYYYFALQKDGKLDECYEGDAGYLRFHQDKGVGIYFYAPNMWDLSYSGGVHYREQITGDLKNCSYVTPAGTLNSIQKYSHETYSWAYLTHFVNNFNDLKIMLYVLQNTVYHEQYLAFDRIDTLWGESGIPAAIPPVSVAPLQKLLSRWAGIETTVNLYMEDSDSFCDILAEMEKTEDKPFDIICRSNARYVEFAENLSSEITGRTFFEQFNAPYYAQRTAELHRSGKTVGIHIDGTLKPCLSLLAGCGFDVAEAVTPAPVGDVEIEDLRLTAGELILIGGIPGALFSNVYSNALFDDHVARLIKACKAARRLMIGVADQVPPDAVPGRIERVRKLIDQLS